MGLSAVPSEGGGTAVGGTAVGGTAVGGTEVGGSGVVTGPQADKSRMDATSSETKIKPFFIFSSPLREFFLGVYPSGKR
jgi:hypothetical protein